METLANVVGGVAWWWVLWHIITEPGHILVSKFILAIQSKIQAYCFRENLNIPMLENGQMKN